MTGIFSGALSCNIQSTEVIRSAAGIREHTSLYSFVSCCIQKSEHTRHPESQVISDRSLYILEIQPSTSTELGSVLDEIYGKAIN